MGVQRPVLSGVEAGGVEHLEQLPAGGPYRLERRLARARRVEPEQRRGPSGHQHGRGRRAEQQQGEEDPVAK